MNTSHHQRRTAAQAYFLNLPIVYLPGTVSTERRVARRCWFLTESNEDKEAGPETVLGVVPKNVEFEVFKHVNNANGGMSVRVIHESLIDVSSLV